MTIPTIHKTNDYEIFKKVACNRDKNPKHLSNIKKLILKDNLLHLHPILVNEKMEVIDGQHRLEVAKELGLDIYYIQDKISYEHILNSNLLQKKASLNDVIKFYALKDAIPSYKLLHECSLELNISPKALLSLLFGNASRSIVDFIKTGKFELPTNVELVQKLRKQYKNFINFAQEKKITPFFMLCSSKFIIAFRNLILMPEFDEHIWLDRLSQRWFEITPQMNVQNWTRLLMDIYFWKYKRD